MSQETKKPSIVKGILFLVFIIMAVVGGSFMIYNLYVGTLQNHEVNILTGESRATEYNECLLNAKSSWDCYHLRPQG